MKFELNLDDDGAIACAKFQKAASNPSKSRLASLKVNGQTDGWTDRVRYYAPDILRSQDE
uniref:Uncharacterized protein n=1 Tax=Magallana gigas TaxID=29159 RepID=K1Q3L6_MAGGI